MNEERQTMAQFERLQELLAGMGRVKVAVSGGVDSLTLSLIAGRVLGGDAFMFHALSAAVPSAATRRVERLAAREGWALRLVDAGELRDEAYLSNPYRRCFHCKNNLYRTLGGAPEAVILSGTNADDLDDFRPGLQAAQEHGVRHPFVECGVDKAGIRRLCRGLGYADIAALPASPCLSSRVETGVPIDPRALQFIDRVETLLRRELEPAVVRCRVRRDCIEVQMDEACLAALRDTDRWRARIRRLGAPAGLPQQVNFEIYRMGSAFVELS